MRHLLTATVLLGMVIATPSWSADRHHDVCFSIGKEDYKDKKKFDQGRNACTRMIISRKYSGKALASIHRARGSWKQKIGELDAAIDDYGIAIEMEPDNVAGYDYRADVYQQKGDLDRALTDYDQAIRLDPTYAAAHYSRALIYEKKNDTAKARAGYDAAIAAPASTRTAQWAQDGARKRLKALDEAKKK
jgi:tetratricopeptide (TPR) repeat protein